MQHDAIIIGGSFAGLSAALQLGRASRSVVVVDAGRPRNRTSPAAHGVPGWDSVPPADILARFRADLVAYPTVRVVDGAVSGVEGGIDAFRVVVEGRASLQARRIVLAHGVRDILPDVPGLAEGWGRRVLHCPYCHGYEVRGRPLAVLATTPMAAHQAQMLRADWSERVTVLSALAPDLDTAALKRAGIAVDPRALSAVHRRNELTLDFTEGAPLEVAALFLAPTISLAGTPAEQLGVALAEGPIGPFVKVGPMMQSSVPGVFAAGDLASPAPSVNFAVGDGARAGAGCHQSLVFPGFIQPVAAAA